MTAPRPNPRPVRGFRRPAEQHGILVDMTVRYLSRAEIADMQGVTQQYVSWIKMTYGGHRTPRERALDHFPWKVPNRFTTASTYTKITDEGHLLWRIPQTLP